MLHLSNTHLTDSHLDLLSHHPTIHITQLWLCTSPAHPAENFITHTGLSYLNDTPWDSLTHLKLCTTATDSVNNIIGDLGCRVLTKLEMPRLEVVNLGIFG